MIKRFVLVFFASIVLAGGLLGTASAAPSVNNPGIYAALGDSVAAGAGLFPKVGDGVPQCGRSDKAYPRIVATEMKLALVHAACSGATADDLFAQQSIGGVSVAPQLDAAFASGTPQLISITAGANDVHWAEFLRVCAASDCATPQNTAAVKAYLSKLKLNLLIDFQNIWFRSNTHPPKVVITGYYNPISNACISRQPYADAKEIAWLNDQRDALNQTIRSVASQYYFAQYASTNFSGHTICSSDPWIQIPTDPAPFHPTARGQQHIAESVLAAARR